MDVEVNGITFSVEVTQINEAQEVYQAEVKYLKPVEDAVERKKILQYEKAVETTEKDADGKPIFEQKIVTEEVTVREIVTTTKPVLFGNFKIYGKFARRDIKTMAKEYIRQNSKLDKLTIETNGNN